MPNSIMSQDGINLATKYEKGLVQAYTRASLLTGKTNTEYNWDGVKSIHVYTAISQPLGDYNRAGNDGNGGHRYGTWNELQDREQELIVNLDKAFAMTIDKGNNDEQMNVKRMGEVVKMQIGEQVTPFFDKYAINHWCVNGNLNTTYQSGGVSNLDKDKVLDLFIDARKWFVNHNIPVAGNVFAYVPTSTYSFLLRNPEFISVEKLGGKILTNGEVGKCMNFRIVETPDDYFPAGAQALFTNKKSVIQASKGTELHRYTNVPGLSGQLIEGRYRGDAFILETLKDGVLYFAATGARSLTLSRARVDVAVGDTATLTATTVPAGQTVTWTSSNTSAATVAAGVVTGVAKGKATITASYTDSNTGIVYKDTCAVTVG